MDWKQLYELLDAKPFRPFEIELVNGRRILVDDPDDIVIKPSRQKVTMIIVLNREADETDFTWGDGIASLHVPPRDGDGSART